MASNNAVYYPADMPEEIKRKLDREVAVHIPPRAPAKERSPETQAWLDRVADAAKKEGLSFQEFAANHIMHREPLKDGSYFR